MTRVIVLYPYKIDKEGTIHIREMAKTKQKGYKAKMKRLTAMGIFVSEELMEIKEGINAKEKTDI